MLLIVRILVVTVWIAVLDAQSPNNYNEPGWAKAGAYLREFMDQTIKPCDNFTGFICGNFGNASDTETYQTWQDVRTRNHLKVLSEAVNGIRLSDTKTPKYARTIRSFYDRCLTNKYDLSMIQPVYSTVADALGPYPGFGPADSKPRNALLDDAWYLMGKMQKEFGAVLAMKASTGRVTDFESGQKFPYLLIEPQVPAGDVTDLENLRNTTLQAANLFKIKVDITYLDGLLDETATFLDDWKNESILRANAQEYFSSAANLTERFPNITWSSYWQGLLTDEAKRSWLKNGEEAAVAVIDSGAMEAVSEVFNKHSLRAIRTAMYSWFLKSLQTMYSGDTLQDIVDTLWVMPGAARKELCLEYVIRNMAPAAARVYFDYIGEDILKWRNQVLLIGRNVFSAMRLLLNSVDYMSAASKELMNKRLDSITLNPGVPSWIMDEDKVLRHNGNYNESQPLFLNDISRKRQQFSDQLKILSDPQNAEDPPPTFELNAMYVSADRKITLFLGHTLPPIFSLSYPLAVKYGRFGAMIGHELMHAVDLANIGADGGTGILEPDELEIYIKQEQCLVQQYSRTCYKKLDGCLVGDKAIRDNIADIGGLKAAYAAYQFARDLLGDEPPVPGLEQYNGDKLFYMTYQRFYCARNEPVGWLTIDHTPNSARAPVALRNNPHFAEAFECAVGSDAAPIKICQLWGDILEP